MAEQNTEQRIMDAAESDKPLERRIMDAVDWYGWKMGAWGGAEPGIARSAAAMDAERAHSALAAAVAEACSSLDFYRRRCDALQAQQSKMRDPERTIVCDVLANGFLLDPPVPPDRYSVKPPLERVCRWTEDEDGVWWSTCGEGWCLEGGTLAENGVRFCQGCGGRIEVVDRG